MMTIVDDEPQIKEKIDMIRSTIDDDDKQAVAQVLEKCKFSVFSSKKIKEFEEKFASYLGGDYAVAVNSGTAALHSAIISAGIKPGDEVIVPSYTYIATAFAVMHQWAKPVFVDISLDDNNIDPEKIKKKITEKTRAIIPVHLFGHPADMKTIMKIAEEHKLKVIEDCAQALGAEINGKKVGTFGDFGCFSFQESKNITTGGEGGMVVAKERKNYEMLKKIMHEGEVYADGTSTARPTAGPLPINYELVGYNYRMNSIQAALGISQLKKLDVFNKKRKDIAKRYTDSFVDIKILSAPKIRDNVEHVFNNFIMTVSEEMPRDLLLNALLTEGVPAMTYYARPMNEYKIFNVTETFPNAKKLCEHQIMLPVYPTLSEKEQTAIIDAIKYVIERLR